MGTYDTVTYETEGRIATVTLNRPEKLNAISAQLQAELIAALDKIKAAGVKVNDADKDAFIAASKAVYADFAKEVPEGGKLVDKAVELGKGM